mmetsp:Transcript_25104/g.74919  ORF Transcript_25104/g.74919 Transcript_25104/m.74919 type:complete len:252 (+) Transcript_25104:134-889(+)
MRCPPCGARARAVKVAPATSGRSVAAQRSRAASRSLPPTAMRAKQSGPHVTSAAAPPALRKTRAWEPSARGRAHTLVPAGMEARLPPRRGPPPSKLPPAMREPALPRGSWLTAITSLLVYVASVYVLISKRLPEMSRGAARTAHMENCARLCSSVIRSRPCHVLLRSRQGSFQPPGPAYLSRPARTSMFLSTPGQSVSSGPVRHALPREAPTGAYQSFHPQRLKSTGRPVAFSASRILPYCAKATAWSVLA